MTTQFTLWDKFKELQEYKDQKLNNLADYLTHLLANKAQSLSVFKVITVMAAFISTCKHYLTEIAIEIKIFTYKSLI